MGRIFSDLLQHLINRLNIASSAQISRKSFSFNKKSFLYISVARKISLSLFGDPLGSSITTFGGESLQPKFICFNISKSTAVRSKFLLYSNSPFSLSQNANKPS